MKSKEFHINRFLSVRLEQDKTMIYVAGQLFIQCKSLLLNIPVSEVNAFDVLESIDEVTEGIESTSGTLVRKVEISPEVEFWGHSSNLQAWYEHNYDTRLIHSNLAFSLLDKLTEVGDPLAKKVFKEEVIDRYENGTDKTREYIRYSGILDNFSIEERMNLILNADDLAFLELVEEVWNTTNPYNILLEFLSEENMKLEKNRVVKLDLSDLDLELKEFPKSILELKSLRILGLSGNYIQKIPENIGELKSLKKLFLDSNEISHIPDSICDITSLEELQISGNIIQTLPEHVGDLECLKTLNLGSNKIKRLPESFCRLTSLKWLNLSDNQLSKLPECFLNFKSLEYLNIRENSLTESLDLIRKLNKMSFDLLD